MFVVSSHGIPYLPAGMTLPSNQSLAPPGTAGNYQQVIGWTANTATYPGSTVSSNALVVQSTGNAAISASVAWSDAFSATGTLQIYRNGTMAIQGSASASGTSGTSTVSGTLACTAGDTIAVWFLLSVYTTTTIVASGTALTILKG